MASQFEKSVPLKHCPACLSEKISDFATGFDYHYNIDGDFKTSECVSCSTVFMNPMPSASDLAGLYPDDYYSYQPPVRENAFRRAVRVLLRYPRVYAMPRFEKPGVMLDVGCGSGHYLLEMQHKGWEVHGAELSEGAAEAGRRAGLDIRGGELMESGYQPKSFDFIRSNHSFEHIPNPDDVLQEIRLLLKDDGKVFIGVPNIKGLWPRIFGIHWWNFGLPVHTFNYSPAGIKAALNRNGFSVRKIVYNSDYSGLVGSLQIRANAKRGLKRSDGSLMSNAVIKLPAHYVSKLLDLFRLGDCIEVIAVKSSVE